MKGVLYKWDELDENLEPKHFNKKIVLKIPFQILLNPELSLNEKLLLGLDFSLINKLGFNQMSHIEVGKLLNLHPNIVGSCRRSLIKKGLLIKKGKIYTISVDFSSMMEGHDLSSLDKRDIKIPFEIYNNNDLKTGEKLLWGEYNSISKGYKYYFAKREHAAKRLAVSVESVSNWTKSLHEKGLFKEYKLEAGYCTHQRKIKTVVFNRD
ncbi:helix-turn-helix domain-containing protein [Elizabethkingia meningoseptica]|uniref:helix-turn-helix domain-containing protein n=1 Tax=Elizabethkingia meningoseptica TaxID=238 RepID=UPI0018EBBEB1|nr:MULTISPECIES: helix-turn-helix domain-containing protein [Elizabethkingia]MDE5430719.1 helix-turn-helix domain-containing protein [Elizabethkingia meningoseptica]